MHEQFYQRLRRRESSYSVSGSLPVLFFGDIFSAAVGTVGLNPSHQEYLDPRGFELTGTARRFETLNSLGADDRRSLTREQCDRAIQTMRGYFQPANPVYRWFKSLMRVTTGMGFSYQCGEVAHLDLVQEATNPAWSQLKVDSPTEAQALLSADLPFLGWQLETFPFSALLCNGRTVYEAVKDLSNGTTTLTGRIARVTWFAGLAEINGETIGLAGWNIPLARPTGLGAKGEAQLGEILLAALNKLGIPRANRERRRGQG
jgi:hypothetical protein